MELYVGMDVSLKETWICAVDGNGEVMTEGTVASNPEAIARFLIDKVPDALRIGLESGPTSTWLWHELRALGLPVMGRIQNEVRPRAAQRLAARCQRSRPRP